MKMKNKTLWVVGGVVVLLIIWGISVYNGLVKAQVPVFDIGHNSKELRI